MKVSDITRNFSSSGYYHVSNYISRTETISLENGEIVSVSYKQWGKEQYKERKFYRYEKEFDVKFRRCVHWLYEDNIVEFKILLNVLKKIDTKYYNIAKSVCND